MGLLGLNWDLCVTEQSVLNFLNLQGKKINK